MGLLRRNFSKNFKVYPIVSYSESIKFIECFLDEMTSGKEFCPIDFTKLINDRLYFPRLFTSENAYINWQWSIEEIERFICAFNAPYQGASTFIDNKRVYLSSVSLDTEIDMHPYTAGLIVQLNNNQVLVATSGGLLRVKSIIYDGGNSVIPNLKEGMRFHTPTNYIEQGLMYKPELNAQGFVKND